MTFNGGQCDSRRRRVKDAGVVVSLNSSFTHPSGMTGYRTAAMAPPLLLISGPVRCEAVLVLFVLCHSQIYLFYAIATVFQLYIMVMV